MKENACATWASHSSVTDPGAMSAALAEVPSEIAGIRRVSQELVVHDTGATDGSFVPIRGERLKEVDLRYAEAMLSRLLELGEPRLARSRSLDERVVGCCRDFSLLFVAMAREKGIPARLRMGYASYFVPGWLVDHVIAEVWDETAARWRLVEPEVTDAFLERYAVGGPFDPTDVPVDWFITGPRAWLAARRGEIDPALCVVSPDLDEPYTRGWLSLQHHVVQDLTALAKTEPILWDEWGILQEPDVQAGASLVDEVARATAHPAVAPEIVAALAADPAFAMPQMVTSYSPAWQGPREVDVTRSLGGSLTSTSGG